MSRAAKKDWGICQWCGLPNTCAPYVIEIGAFRWKDDLEYEVCQLCSDRWRETIHRLVDTDFLKVKAKQEKTS